MIGLATSFVACATVAKSGECRIGSTWSSAGGRTQVGASQPHTRASLRTIRCPTGLLFFKTPFDVQIAEEGGGWVAEAPKYGVCSFGVTEREALDGLLEDICVLWQAIGMAPDEDLTPGAQAVKRTLVESVESYWNG